MWWGWRLTPRCWRALSALRRQARGAGRRGRPHPGQGQGLLHCRLWPARGDCCACPGAAVAAPADCQARPLCSLSCRGRPQEPAAVLGALPPTHPPQPNPTQSPPAPPPHLRHHHQQQQCHAPHPMNNDPAAQMYPRSPAPAGARRAHRAGDRKGGEVAAAGHHS